MVRLAFPSDSWTSFFIVFSTVACHDVNIAGIRKEMFVPTSKNDISSKYNFYTVSKKTSLTFSTVA